MTEWQYDKLFNQPDGKMIREEHTSYYYDEKGKLIRHKVTRKFFGENDYIDSTETEPLG